MSTVNVMDAKGKKAGTADLSDAVFAVDPNMHVMHRTVVAQQAGWRQGTSDTKNRSAVNGGGKKPWRQKGTGRARQGTIRAPQWRGGGVVFGPHPRKYDAKVNSKEVKLALRSILSTKAGEDAIVVVKPFSFEKPSTKEAAAALKALGLDGQKVTLVVSNEDVTTYLSFRNIPEVEVLPVNSMNAYDLIDNNKLVIQDDCLGYIEEVLA